MEIKYDGNGVEIGGKAFPYSTLSAVNFYKINPMAIRILLIGKDNNPISYLDIASSKTDFVNRMAAAVRSHNVQVTELPYASLNNTQICPTCLHIVADNAYTCPSCGNTFKKQGGVGFWGIVFAVVVAVIIISMG